MPGACGPRSDRKAHRRTQGRAHGPPRRVDRSAEPFAVQREARHRDRSRGRHWRKAGGAGARSRPLQGRQRRVRPCRGRPGADQSRRYPAPLRRGDRHAGPHWRRRIHHPPARPRAADRRLSPGRLHPRHVPPGDERQFRPQGGRRLDRRFDLPGGRPHRRRAAQCRRHGALQRQVQRPRHRRLLFRRHGCRPAPAPSRRKRAAPRGSARPAVARLPAAVRCLQRHLHRI
ncbi:hypothetical protein D3C87_1480460 [compost metagenome]